MLTYVYLGLSQGKYDITKIKKKKIKNYLLQQFYTNTHNPINRYDYWILVHIYIVIHGLSVLLPILQNFPIQC